jgi:hypothetical protein
MKTLAMIITAPALLTLAACSSEEPDTNNSADDFAARINGDTQAPKVEATVAPTIAPPRENAAPGAYAPGTATDPASQTCNANKMGPFLGRPADDATRLAVMSAAAGAAEVRFVQPGSDFISPDPTNPRLNIMLDNQGIIRDARCG